ncbi:hypothetical protein M5689_024717 [Euphorbia peplus]|nr:hypothetical protein M5689_024717 [Euphorbia peplus]
MLFAKEMIVPTTFYRDLNRVQRHRRLRQVFQGAVGALDGTLIHAVVPAEQQTLYRGRGECYQNVLSVCDFDMIFTLVWVGWEGVAHDSRVLTETMRDPSNNFLSPPHDKYYLCDAQDMIFEGSANNSTSTESKVRGQTNQIFMSGLRNQIANQLFNA